MVRVDPNKAGLALGALCAGWHLLWAALVASGWAQPLIDFIFWMHFIKPVYVVGPFNVLVALVLVGATGGIAYLIGCAFGVLWNRLHR